MKNSILTIVLSVMIFLIAGLTNAKAEPIEGEIELHNWEAYSTHYETVDGGSHAYTYWKNFMEQTRTCAISHKLKSVVYYCDVHDHTDSQIFFEETIHSERHE